MLVPWTCSTGRQCTLYLVTGAMLLLVATSGWISWPHWQRTRHERPGEARGTLRRSRFMAVAGLLSSSMFLLAILAQGLPSLVLSACAPWVWGIGVLAMVVSA